MMLLNRPPWHTLSQLSGARGVKADWQGFPEHLLKPTQDLAESYPCLGRCGGYMDVVKHSDGQYMGICPTCDKQVLNKLDLVVYRPDFAAIFAALARAFGLEDASHTTVDGITQCWQIGEYNPAASYRFPVLTLIEAQTERIERVIGQIAAKLQKPFFMLLPSASAVTQSVQDIAYRNGGKVFAYEDLIELEGDALQVRGTAAAILADLSAGWIKHSDDAEGATRYPTPAGATWGDIMLEFTADEMVTVSCKGSGHKQYSAEDFSMRDKKTKKPKKAWAFLQAMALVSGNMPISNIEELKKDKQAVSQSLQALFHLDDDPIMYSKDDGAMYKTKFVIRGGDKLTIADARRRRAG